MAPKRPPPARPEPESEEDEEITEEEDFDGDDEEEEELDLTEVMNEMPLDVRRRVYSLKGYAKEFNDLMGKFREEVATLELQLLAKRKPFFEERRKIITGDRDVTAEEVSASKKVAEAASKVEEIQSSEEEDAKKGPRKGVKIVAPKDKPTEEEKGVPGFWMYALKHNEVLRHMISDRDEEVLKFLEDISIDYVDNKPTKGFVLTFHFLDNPFFSNNTLTKTCLWEQEREGDEETIDKLTGCTIDWKAPSQNVTVTIKEKKQRHKSGKGVRVVKHEEKAPSFFHFFSPLQLNDEGEVIGKVEEDEDPQELVEIDEDMTLAIANNVIPRATFYYTGEALAKLAQQLTMELQGDGLEEGEEEEEDEEEESEEEEKPAPPRGRGGKAPGGRGAAPGGRGRGAAPPADCKTQ